MITYYCDRCGNELTIPRRKWPPDCPYCQTPMRVKPVRDTNHAGINKIIGYIQLTWTACDNCPLWTDEGCKLPAEVLRNWLRLKDGKVVCVYLPTNIKSMCNTTNLNYHSGP